MNIKGPNDKEILEKYLRPPSLELVMEVIKEFNVRSFSLFEKYCGIAQGTIKNFRYGSKGIPVKHWPLFYEKKIPPHAIDYERQMKYKKRPWLENKVTKTKKAKKKINPTTNASILEKLKGISQ